MTIQSSQALHSAPFTVDRVDPLDYPCVAAIASCWSAYAQQLNNSSWSRKYSDSTSVCSSISMFLLREKRSDRYEVYVCRDWYEQTKGIIIFKSTVKSYENYARVRFLATRPDHISLNRENAVRGVGTCLLRFAEDRARSLGIREMGLHTTFSARKFYLNRGFSHCEDGEGLTKKL